MDSINVCFLPMYLLTLDQSRMAPYFVVLLELTKSCCEKYLINYSYSLLLKDEIRESEILSG